MKKLSIRPYDLYRYLADLVKSRVCDVVFVEERPSVVADKMNAFVVVGMPRSLEDFGLWQNSLVRFELYARNRSNGQPSLDVLQSMLDKCVAMFPVNEGAFLLWKPRLVLSGTDNAGFTIWNVQCNARVNTTNRIE